jgi:hypothetical protein
MSTPKEPKPCGAKPKKAANPRRASRRTQPHNLSDALLKLPKGTLTHDELTELALGLMSDLHTGAARATNAAITGKVKSLEILLKVSQDKRESERENSDETTPLLELLKGLS